MTVRFHVFDNFRKRLLIAVVLVGFLAAPVAHFVIDLVLGQQSFLEQLNSSMQLEWSDSPGLIILGLLNLIPYLCLSGILYALSFHFSRVAFCWLVLWGFLAAVGTMIDCYYNALVPYHSGGHVSSTTAIIYFLQPFFGLFFTLLALLVGSLFLIPFWLKRRK
ncbi:hypothetical protein [Endozoicomonas arenosclerae]|uniref:hypothetical protein n=1 Tax=Endozoicomonas arenosclerae TaxID=1633495 RepID=UPI000783AAF0|nr:hypothetical protein [Endozoicomonas arenosclerae]